MSDNDYRIVPKVWGEETWIINDKDHQYCHKKLKVKKGAACSKHHHRIKLETFTLESGKIQLILGDEIIDMLPGDSRTVVPGMWHSFCGYEDSVITEVSTYHDDDDSYREWESHLKPEIFGFDIDGTLEGSDTDPGVVTAKHIGDKEFVIVSSRSRKRSQEVCDRMGIVPLKIYCCRVVGRAEELKRVDRDFPLRRTCFPAGTKISCANPDFDKVYLGMGKGNNNSMKSVEIEKLKIGDVVLSYNEKSGIKEFKKISNVSKIHSNSFVTVKFSNHNELRCTFDHPIAVNRKGRIKWIEAGNLSLNDECIQYRYPGYKLRLRAIENRGKKLDAIYGHKKADEMISHQSLIKTGKLNPMYGKEMNEDEKRYRSDKNKFIFSDPDHYVHSKENSDTISNALKRSWSDPSPERLNGILKGGETKKQKAASDKEYALKLYSNITPYVNKRGMNKLEDKFNFILQDICPDEFIYTGSDNEYYRKFGFYPDFVNVRGKRKAIEVFATYWKELNYGSVGNYKTIRSKQYSEIEWEVLFLEDIELQAIKSVEEKISNYVYNPNTDLVKVVDILFDDSGEFSYNLEVEENNNYFAYGILVHNCYVGDALTDRDEAILAGWNFCFPHEFAEIWS